MKVPAVKIFSKSLLILAYLITTSCTKRDTFQKDFPFVRTSSFESTDESLLFKGEVIFLGESDIIDHGFVWSTSISNPVIGTESTRSLGPLNTTGEFLTAIKSDIIAGNTYFFRAYVKNENKVVYGNVIAFVALRDSPPPIITDFAPKNGTWGDQIAVNVENSNVDNVNKNKFKIGNISVTPIATANEGEFILVVPDLLSTAESTLTVSVGNQNNTTPETFHLNAPEIESINPESGVAGIALTVTGKYFSTKLPVTLNLGTTEVAVEQITSTTIECHVPNLVAGDKTVSVTIIGQTGIFGTPFQYLEPEAGTFAPQSGIAGIVVEIAGNNFVTGIENNEVLFGNKSATIISVTSILIKAYVPVLTVGDYIITVNSGLNSAVYSGFFTVTPPPANLIAYYPLDGSAEDGSGNGFDGQLIGNVTFGPDRNGSPDGAAVFDGVDAAIDLGTMVGNQARTISLWFKPNQTIDNSITDYISLIVRNNGIAGPNTYEFTLNFTKISGNQGRIEFSVSNGTPTVFIVRSNSNQWAADTWYHVVGVIDPTDGMKLYINGVLQNETNSYSSNTGTTSTITALGRWGDLLTRYFNGSIDQVRLYDGALSEAEIQALYNQ